MRQMTSPRNQHNKCKQRTCAHHSAGISLDLGKFRCHLCNLIRASFSTLPTNLSSSTSSSQHNGIIVVIWSSIAIPREPENEDSGAVGHFGRQTKLQRRYPEVMGSTFGKLLVGYNNTWQQSLTISSSSPVNIQISVWVWNLHKIFSFLLLQNHASLSI